MVEQQSQAVRSSLVFDETLISDFSGPLRAEDINNGFNMGLQWRQKANGNYELTRLQTGRVVVTNYDPMALTDRQRFELNEKIRQNPRGFVYLDVRPDGPGGDFPIRGAIKLRSMLQILTFIAKGIRTAEEFPVLPDPRTGNIKINPTATLKVNLSNIPPGGNLPYVLFEGDYYTIDSTRWDRTSFAMLSILFQTTVGSIENVGIPVTIAK